MLGQIILQIILIALSALLTCAETAVISINDTRLEKLAAGGSPKALKLKKLTSKPNSFLSTLQTAAVLCVAVASAFAAVNFGGRIAGLISGSKLPESAVKAVSIVAAALVITFFTLVFGSLVPKKAAARDPEKLALRLAGAVLLLRAVFAPLVWLLNHTSRGILRLMGIDPNKEDDAVTEEEIMMMSDAGAEKGTIDEDENRIIKNVFAFDDLSVGQICTHRTDVSVLWSSDPVEVWEETIHRTRHSEFPICGESVDNVVGVLNAKDYFRLDDKSMVNIMENAVHEPFFVHENMKADRLFAHMKKNGGDHFAIVVDEYGGMSGIITVTDLVEELVGDFDDDELDEPEAVFEQTGDNQWLIPGITSLSEVCSELDITLPAEKYDTFSGYVIAVLGEIPRDGTRLSLDSDGLHIEVLEIQHHRIEVCLVTKTAEADEDLAEA